MFEPEEESFDDYLYDLQNHITPNPVNLSIEDAKIINDAWGELFNYPLIIEMETKGFGKAEEGYIIAHMTPQKHPDYHNGYFTLFCNPDYKKESNTKFYLEYITHYADTQEEDADVEILPIAFVNNIQSVATEIVNFWSNK